VGAIKREPTPPGPVTYLLNRLHQIHRLNNEECEFCANYLDGDA